MKILFVTTGDIKELATMKRALGLANPLSALGWQVKIIAKDTEENRKRILLECDKTIETYYFTKTSLKGEVLEKNNICNAIKPDIIYLCAFGPRNFIFKSRKLRNALFLVEHSELASAIPDNNGIKKIKTLLFEFYSIIYASHLVIASKYLMQVYSKRLKQLRIRNREMHYSPYAYNSIIIEKEPIILAKLKEKYQGSVVFLYMGTMTRNYGLFTMLDAIKKLRQNNKKAVLLLMGRGRHLEEAKDYVVSEQLTNYVHFLDYIPEEELSSYFKLTDAFIAPLNNTEQDWARCPSKIYMYLPFEKPILTTNIGEPKHIFGDYGFYFDAAQPESLTQLFINVINKEFILSRINISEHSWDFRAKELDNWLKSVKVW